MPSQSSETLVPGTTTCCVLVQMKPQPQAAVEPHMHEQLESITALRSCSEISSQYAPQLDPSSTAASPSLRSSKVVSRALFMLWPASLSPAPLIGAAVSPADPLELGVLTLCASTLVLDASVVMLGVSSALPPSPARAPPAATG